MYEYISGKVSSASATQVVLDCGGVGYLLEVTLNTYAEVKESETARLWVHEIVREDAYQLYGFVNQKEREMFRQLLTVSGVGASTARIMLSSLTVDELASAIVNQNAKLVQGVKGIGAKTAQRIILELKDKVGAVGASETPTAAATSVEAFNQNKADAQAALIMLGFPKPAVEKVMKEIDSNLTVEQMMKQAMQRL